MGFSGHRAADAGRCRSAAAVAGDVAGNPRLSVALGVPLAWLLARRRFLGRSLVRALVTLPMVLPPVVGGIALLYAFGRQGFAGQILYDLTGWRLVFTTAGAILAQTFVAMPFLVVTAEAAFRTLDRRTEEVAATLGPDPAYRSGGQAQRVALARALAPVGNRARVRVAGPVPLVAEVTTAAVAELGLADGGTVWASVKATDVEVYPA